MSFRRIFIWKCDKCAFECTKETYKLPPGWTWGGNPTTHLCDQCSQPFEVGENQQRGKKKDL